MASKITIKSLEYYQKAFIAGRFVDSASGSFHTVLNPANGSTVGKIPNCTYDETNQAIQAAAKAQEQWQKVVPIQRAKLMRKLADALLENREKLGEIITLEGGKPHAEAMGENGISADWFNWYAGEAERMYGDLCQPHRPGVMPVIAKKPIGVVGIITPWNHPSAMVTRSAAGAIGAGCGVVLKPSELTPFSSLVLADIMDQLGFPKGLFNVVTGLPKPIGTALTDSPIVRKMCFTGSTRVGKLLMEQSVKTVKHCAMELGGNAPFIVFEDADLDNAVQGLMVGKFRGAGQTCISMNRVYVHEKVHDAFVEKMIVACGKLKTGNGMKPGVTMGPVINKAAADRIWKNIEIAKSEGAKVVCGGKAPEGISAEEKAAGCFIEPTILVNVNNATPLACNEIFGPVLPFIKFSDKNEAVRLANDTNAGLAAYFYTTDADWQREVANRLHYGMVGINDGMLSSPFTPFGGVKESGLGRDGSKYGIAEFLDVCLHLYGRSKL